jgi:hypothetical protein
MSDTPRTDEQRVFLSFDTDADGLFIKLVEAEFARTLERQLAEAQAEIERMQPVVLDLCGFYSSVQDSPGTQNRIDALRDNARAAIDYEAKDKP